MTIKTYRGTIEALGASISSHKYTQYSTLTISDGQNHPNTLVQISAPLEFTYALSKAVQESSEVVIHTVEVTNMFGFSKNMIIFAIETSDGQVFTKIPQDIMIFAFLTIPCFFLGIFLAFFAVFLVPILYIYLFYRIGSLLLLRNKVQKAIANIQKSPTFKTS